GTRHRLPRPGRPRRLPARPAARGAVGGAPADARPVGDVRRAAALRRGGGGAGPARRAGPGPAGHRGRLDRRVGGPQHRLRPAVPAHLGRGRAPVRPDRRGAAARRGDAADRGLPGRRRALRHRRPPPGGGGPGAGLDDDQRARGGGAHRGRRRPGPAAGGPADQGPRAGVRRAGAAAAADAGADRAEPGPRLRRAGRDGRGVGLPLHAAAGPDDGPAGDGADLVHRGVRAGGGAAAADRPADRGHRDRGVPAAVGGAVPAAAQPQLGRRHHRAAARHRRPRSPDL
ncbi:MAG: transcriptional regulator, partial [uncultured Corynebacteriales bacterium]